jgi:phosphopantothenoylcysteine decarboxylase/phosphopantothenate--cysteine ligase
MKTAKIALVGSRTFSNHAGCAVPFATGQKVAKVSETKRNLRFAGGGVASHLSLRCFPHVFANQPELPGAVVNGSYLHLEDPSRRLPSFDQSSYRKRLGNAESWRTLSRVNCIVTAGPTFEPLDEVRRLTNFSTGKLGSELANFLSDKGHNITLLIGHQATWYGEQRAQRVETFTTTADLSDRLRALATQQADVVFHASAVSDFTFRKIWTRAADGQLMEIKSGKVSARQGALLAELVPTLKIIARLREWFPKARLIGWKYEVDGDRDRAIQLARQQIAEYRTDACVANGPAYGEGFALVTEEDRHIHLPDKSALFEALEKFIRR